MNRTTEEDVLVPKKLATQGPDYAALAVDYLEAVNRRFQDAPEKYEEFLEALRSMKSRSAVRTAVAKVKVFLEDHPDLIVGFNVFLPPGYAIPTEDGECERHTGTGEATNMQQQHVVEPSREIEIEDTSTVALHQDAYHPEYIFCQEVKKKFGNSYDYREFLKCLYIYSEEIISLNELKGMVVSLVGDDEYLTGFIESKKIFGDQRPAYRIENPSYRLWPKNRPLPITSHRTKLGYEVLNDIFISESSTRDEDFKNTQKNKYEERIFRCEDNWYELDMLSQLIKDTIMHAEELLNKIETNIFESKRSELIEAHFTNRYLWCIELLYGDHGLEVTDLLKENPDSALPVILRRLKQKENELAAYRSEYRKVMTEIRSKNYKKSLGHRSFELKKQDMQEQKNKTTEPELAAENQSKITEA